MTIAEICQLLTALAAVGAMLSSWRNARKIDVSAQNLQRLEKNTNSISERNEAIARKLGMKEGIEKEKANPSGDTYRDE